MDDDRDAQQSEWQRWQAQSPSRSTPDPRRQPSGAAVFLGALVADFFIVAGAYVAGIAIGFQSWSESQDVVHSLAGKQEGQILTATAIACLLLALVALWAWRRRAMVAVALQAVVIVVVLVVAGSMARDYHHMSQTPPMSWLGLMLKIGQLRA